MYTYAHELIFIKTKNAYYQEFIVLILFIASNINKFAFALQYCYLGGIAFAWLTKWIIPRSFN